MSAEVSGEVAGESDEPNFERLQIDPRIIAALTELGFTAPTPIQAKAIPPLLEGRDLVGRARTGSGKTAAFGLPLLDMLSRGGEGVRALVLAPTRELAIQITAALRSYGAGLRLQMVTLYGGASYHPQLSALRRGVDVVVGTPGRLLDHIGRGSLDLSGVQLVVIDEADEMLRMGFVEDLTAILETTPDTRQVALFSATMPAPIRAVAETYLSAPLEVQVEQRGFVVEHIEQYRIDVPNGRELDTLVRVLKSKAAGATLIFARTRVTCDQLSDALRDRGFNVQALHGNMSQPARESVLGALRTRRLDLVVATDVAARGIDVEHLTHVINFNMPEEVEVYVNRIGRTGRAGRKGVAISLVTRRDLRLLRRIEKQIKAKISPRPVPSNAQIVGRQRADLESDLQAALQHRNEDSASALRDVLQQGGWTAESLATAALGLLMQDRHLDIEAAPSEEPPPWARRPERTRKTKARAGPGQRRPKISGQGRPKIPRDRAAAEQATVSAAAGREHGIGPGDVVGALANELGVPTQAIGRITILDRHLTVSLSEEAAAYLARERKTVFLRGNPVTFTRPGGERAAAAERPAPTGYLRHPNAKASRAKSTANKKKSREVQEAAREGKGTSTSKSKSKRKRKSKGKSKSKGKRKSKRKSKSREPER